MDVTANWCVKSTTVIITATHQPCNCQPEDFKNQQCPDFNIDPDTNLIQRQLDEEYLPPDSTTSCLVPTRSTVPACLLQHLHIGAWLSTLPVECLGLLLSDDAVHIRVALRLDVIVQHPHR
ncbi:hypothetical protein Pmani_017348 [Petrolisthes manimaculis]|uniref:Uncharacterized protein n=1 Tax=Petrolisthes manimaculis TaxID=1843537 RepID=A0AAE1PMJ2_9EUCA|nr:hypothetical protein Pmani_024450 [Petrolisthes manimaculis]KAK4311146.1 hypothetical protein Pmani_017348 [Petrolisthes manimaculis]